MKCGIHAVPINIPTFLHDNHPGLTVGADRITGGSQMEYSWSDRGGIQNRQCGGLGAKGFLEREFENNVNSTRGVDDRVTSGANLVVDGQLRSIREVYGFWTIALLTARIMKF